MQAPKCKLCGEQHWSPVCPKFSKNRTVARVAQIASQPAPKRKKAKSKRGKK